jgi:hypothetical protein
MPGVSTRLRPDVCSTDMAKVDHNSLYPNCEVATRVVCIGGRGRAALTADLNDAGVEINELGLQLLASDAFSVSIATQPLATVELTARNLGLPQGGVMSAIVGNATALGLSRCPMELGPYLRLQYLDQVECLSEEPTHRHRAPPGSVTIVSEPISQDDEFPKGFYLRCIHGKLWLRGYRSDARHTWSPDDRLIFSFAGD